MRTQDPIRVIRRAAVEEGESDGTSVPGAAGARVLGHRRPGRSASLQGTTATVRPTTTTRAKPTKVRKTKVRLKASPKTNKSR